MLPMEATILWFTNSMTIILQKQLFHLNEYFADVLALSHKPESSLYVVCIKHSRLEWFHRAVSEPT